MLSMSDLIWSRVDTVADPTDTLSSLAEYVASCLYRQGCNTMLMLLAGFKETDEKEYYGTLLLTRQFISQYFIIHLIFVFKNKT